MRRLAATALAAVFLAIPACDRPTPVAPGEAGLTISANPARIEVDGRSTITVIARKSDGNPVNEGTEINFSTTLGTIDTLVTTTDRGIAEAVLRGDGTVGTAMVSASSGAAAPVDVEVQIGSLAASINLEANPRRLPKEGGDVTLVATVFDDRGNRLRNHPVNFSSEAGTLNSGGSAVNTDNSGEARDTVRVTEFDVEKLEEGLFLVFARTTTEGGVLLEVSTDVEVGGFPASITLSVGTSSVPEDGITDLAVRALVRTDGGKAAPGVGVNFFTQLGSLASEGRLIETDESGQATDLLTITESNLCAFTDVSFEVSAETAGAAGELIDATRSVGLEVPITTLDANFTRSIVALSVSFFDTTTGGKKEYEYLWNFGDGSTSTAQNPNRTYAAPGTYTVILDVTDACGKRDTQTSQVTVM